MLERECTFENYEIDMYNQYAYTKAIDFVQGKEVHQGVGIFGLRGTGKTGLLYAMLSETTKIHPGAVTICVQGKELADQLRAATENKYWGLWYLKRKYKAYQMIFIDGIQAVFDGGISQKNYSKLFHYLIKRKVRIVFTQDCSEELYCALSKISDFCRNEGQVMMVGIPKPGMNRNLQPIRIFECDEKDNATEI